MWPATGAAARAAGVSAAAAYRHFADHDELLQVVRKRALDALAAAMRASLPAWLGWLGVLTGIVSLATIFFVGAFAWRGWILGASIVLLVAREA